MCCGPTQAILRRIVITAFKMSAVVQNGHAFRRPAAPAPAWRWSLAVAASAALLRCA